MTQYLDLPDGRLAYTVAGDGPLVVCAPGMGDIKESYRFLAPVLVEAGYRVAVMDVRGHGESSTGWPAYRQSDVGRDILALIKHLGGPAVVVGQSFTPDSALVAATEAPADVVATVLMAPWARKPAPNAVMRLLQSAVVRVPALWLAFYAYLYPGVKPADFAEYRRLLRTRLRRRDGMKGLAAMVDGASVDAHGYRARASQPALVVMGSKDPDFKDPRAEAELMAAAVAGPTEVAMIDDAGHYPHAQAPEESAQVIIRFLASVLRTDA